MVSFVVSGKLNNIKFCSHSRLAIALIAKPLPATNPRRIAITAG
ncbi:hypothetical protein YPC_2201 [Yersinia pestis biovar Medievalis str. Harbin 35]|nr:hypothetical protein YPC_2201 [Yersinia pestis biovar Medievalis str. Harbin 35]EEO80809.1 hypothetical protein YPF_2602 [Yersinia pestis biovar Orientalis str. India 195]EEO83916.1 hypothetical protein YPH_4562 [Yersinia pestis biovar Orientalis str. PEXU2]